MEKQMFDKIEAFLNKEVGGVPVWGFIAGVALFALVVAVVS